MMPAASGSSVRVHKRGIGPAIVAASVVVVGMVWLLSFGDADDQTRASLVAEFGDSYGLTAPTTGAIVEVDLVAAPATIEVIAGAVTDVWAFNGTVPGPPLRVDLDDTLRVNLYNQLSEPTTIHWHGVRVPNDMDGVPGVNQPAVEPDGRHTYEFTAPDAGTYWYHSHTNGSEQLERGLYGSLIVEDAAPDEWSQDMVWVIDDWLLNSEGEIDPDFDTAADREHNGRWGTTVTLNGSTQATVAARPGERLRIRMINASNGRIYAPRFDDLDARVIAVDGLLTRVPLPAAGFVVAPGSRIDIDLVVPDKPGSYTVSDDFTGDVLDLATIIVSGESVDTPDFVAPSDPDLPVWAGATEVDVDREYLLNIGRANGGWQWTMNNRTYPDVDVLEIEPGSFTRIRLTNESQLHHPMHLHGQFFKVLTRNGEAVDEGHFRDTVLLYPGDQVDIGLVALDAGTWAFHCHIQEHAAAGMLTLVDVAEQS